SVRVTRLAFLQPPPPAPFDPAMAKELAGRILFRDASVLVLDKPAGLPVQGGPGITRHLDGLLDGFRFEAAERPRLVHRLDRDTAGVLVIARTASAAAELARAFRAHAVTKTYWAVVIGCPVPPEGRVDLPLMRTRARFARTALAGAEAGKPAVTDYRTLDHAGRRFSWLSLSPSTGRTHQLRVHCAAVGTPILGDSVYGEAETAMDFPKTLHLFARALAFPHPDGGRLTVEALLPSHLAETFAMLGFRAPKAADPRHE
ncbi:MAG: RluA family pseudouridine synthase, partial [Acetobacteraceae bacterium]